MTHPASSGPDEHWKAADGPHRVAGRVIRDSLVIEAGALVCGGAGATLEARVLRATGTADAPIVFAAEDSAAPWDGIRTHHFRHDSRLPTGRTELVHAVVRDAVAGISGDDVLLESVRVERACRGGTPLDDLLVEPSCSAVHSTSAARLRNVVIQGSGDVGVHADHNARLELNDVRIEGSAGIGLDLGMPGDARLTPGELTAMGLRITGGGSYPARVSAHHLPSITPSQAAVEGLLGNARDTLIVRTVWLAGADTITIFRDLPVVIVSQGESLWTEAVRLELGSHVEFRGTQPDAWYVARMDAVGTEAAPILLRNAPVITARRWTDSLAEPDTVRLSQVVLEGGSLHRRTGFLILEHARITNAAVSVSNLDSVSAATIRFASFDSVTILVAGELDMDHVSILNAPSDAAAVEVSAGGILRITQCDIRGSAGPGLLVRESASPGTVITECNIVGNGGEGVRNLSPYTVDARRNWWGDAAGPSGPDGDGILGDVLVEPVLTSPVSW